MDHFYHILLGDCQVLLRLQHRLLRIPVFKALKDSGVRLHSVAVDHVIGKGFPAICTEAFLDLLVDIDKQRIIIL